MKITLRKIHGSLVPYSAEDAEALQKLSDAVYTVDIRNLDTRTLKQNSAIHKWCELIAHELNKNRLYMTGIFSSEIQWTMESVKLNIVKAIISKVFGINSTTKLKRKEVDEMIDYITVAFAHKNIEIPKFPSKELWDDRH